MALNPLRHRRALTTLTALHRTLSTPNPTVPAIIATGSNSARTPPPSLAFGIFQSRWFRSSGGPLSSARQYKLYKEGDEITEDTVLFEGCDYNHWLIVVDFPKDNKPPPEEMIRTYEQICAQGLGISVEEAKKRIYACSTTTYEGFQVLMSEEESEKFNNVPGVVFVLPDSYIDPVKKEYGGDKYENGVITPRPPPVQYRNQGGRFRRNPDQPRYDRQGNPMQNQQGNPPYNQQGNPPYNQRGYVQGDGRNYGPPQNYPPRQNYPPQQNYGPQPQVNRDYAPQGGNTSDQGSYKPQEQPYHQGANPGYGQNHGQGPPNPGYRQNYGQVTNPGYGQQANHGYGHTYGQEPNHGHGQNFGQGANPGYGQNFGQEANHGYGQSYGQGPNPAPGHNYGPGATAGSGQMNPGYGQTYPDHGAGHGFSQAERRNVQGEPSGWNQGGMQQGRY